MPTEKKLLTVPNVLKALGLVAFLVATYFVAEIVQYRIIGKQSEQLVKVTTTLDDHVEQTKDAFTDFKDTMREQRTHNEKMSNAQAANAQIQKSLQEEDRRICKKIEDLEKKVDKGE